jgi:hypothetical protein
MQNYKGQGENFKGSVGPQDAAKYDRICGQFFKLFFSRDLTDTIDRERHRHGEQFLRGLELSARWPVRTWKPVTEEFTLY